MIEAAHQEFTKWRNKVKQDMIDLNLTNDDMNQTSQCLKKKIKENIRAIMKNRIMMQTATKSTVLHYVNSKRAITRRLGQGKNM